nr:protein charlatan isoform X2 [Aedes albopictus]
MTTLIPTSQPTGVEAYEDMFKEITRKLYGDESGHGLYPHNTQVAQVAQLASGAPAAPEGGERSFTTLVSDRSTAQIDYENNITTVTIQQQQQQGGQQQQQQQQQSGGGFKSEEHLTTAFGLAALMQNGFPPPGAILNPVNFPVGATLKPSTNIAIATTDDRWQQQTQQSQPQDQQQQQSVGGQEQTWTPNGKQSSSASYSQKTFKKPKIEPQDGSPTGAGVSTLNIPQTGSDKNKANFGSAAVGAATGKRYSCTSCPYTTDRRDLFTRHENIHKEEKPFHCYACLKQFNRADHVKKHFLRMHRDMEYEITKTRKSVGSKNNYYTNVPVSSAASTVPVSATVTQSLVSQPATIIQQTSNTLNIPTATFPTQITIPTHHTPAIEHNTVSHDITTLNGVVHHVTQQHQQQQQQQAVQPPQPQPPHQPTQIILSAPPIVTIKQEKGGAITTTTTTAAAVAAATAIVQNTQPRDIVDEIPSVDDKSLVKKLKGEKRFSCCYCPWTGADNWGLKRHLNTHTKPFVCMLCDYKAARSERLATHVFKVHNKKACNKCTYFAEDQDQLNTHLLEAHPHDASKPQPKTTTVVISANNVNSGNNVVGSITQNTSTPVVVTATAPTLIPPTSSSITVGTGNVLRNLGNTFVTNTNIPGSVSGNSSFGTTANTNIYHTITTSATTGNILTNSNASNLIDTINAHLAQQQQQQQQQTVVTNNVTSGVSGGGGGTIIINPGNGIGGGVTQVISNGQQHHLHQQSQQQQQQQQTQPSSQHHQSSQSQSQPQQPQQQQTTHHWIAKVNRKRGAELLYSYLEADGSDSEDYARLLNMQAIGRNKASVTQDFHNAGGGNQHLFSNSHGGSINSSRTNKLSLLVAASSSSASCSPTGSPSPPPTMVLPADCYTTASQKHQKLPIANGMAMANLTEEHLSLLQLLATAAVAQQHLQQQQQQLQQQQLKATPTSISTSPPANHPHHQQQQQPNHHHYHQNSTNNATSDNGSKRRRKSSSRNDKENLVQRHPAIVGKVIDLTTSANNGTTTGPAADNGIERNNNIHNGSSNNNNSSINNKNINEAIFDRVYKKPYNMFLTSAFCKPTSIVEKEKATPAAAVPKDENFSLSEFLRNHKEVSISTLAEVRHAKASRGVAIADEDDVIFVKEEKRIGRKQQQPRRTNPELKASPLVIAKPSADRQQIGDIRDKHMIRLISRKLCCRICQNQQRLEHMDNCHYHSKTSLILHHRWRHGSRPTTWERCKMCQANFDRRYKLLLHQRLHHSRRQHMLTAKKSVKSSKSKKALVPPAGSKRKAAASSKKQQRKRKPKGRSGGGKCSSGKRRNK